MKYLSNCFIFIKNTSSSYLKTYRWYWKEDLQLEIARLIYLESGKQLQSIKPLFTSAIYAHTIWYISQNEEVQ